MRIEAFTRYNEMTGDAYVMDYTQATAGKRKVCIKEEDPDDIASFHLINPRKTTYWAVNFEENPAVLKGSDQCECMFVSSRASSKGWVCLVELKYCLEKNIERNAGDAFKQLYETLNIPIGHRLLLFRIPKMICWNVYILIRLKYWDIMKF